MNTPHTSSQAGTPDATTGPRERCLNCRYCLEGVPIEQHSGWTAALLGNDAPPRVQRCPECGYATELGAWALAHRQLRLHHSLTLTPGAAAPCIGLAATAAAWPPFMATQSEVLSLAASILFFPIGVSCLIAGLFIAIGKPFSHAATVSARWNDARAICGGRLRWVIVVALVLNLLMVIGALLAGGLVGSLLLLGGKMLMPPEG